MRLTNQSKWDQRFFAQMNQQEKLLWIYLNDNCNEAGFIQESWGRWATDIGGLESTSRELFTEKLLPFGVLADWVADGYWFIAPFLKEQCGRLSRKSPGHNRVWRAIDLTCPDLLENWESTHGLAFRFKPSIK